MRRLRHSLLSPQQRRCRRQSLLRHVAPELEQVAIMQPQPRGLRGKPRIPIFGQDATRGTSRTRHCDPPFIRQAHPVARTQARAGASTPMCDGHAFSASPPGIAGRRTASSRTPMPVVHVELRLARTNRKVRSRFTAAWIAGSSPAMTIERTNERKKGKRNADRRVVRTLRAFGAAARACTRACLSAFHRGSCWECRNTPVQLQAMLPGTRPPRLFR